MKWDMIRVTRPSETLGDKVVRSVKRSKLNHRWEVLRVQTKFFHVFNGAFDVFKRHKNLNEQLFELFLPFD